jgi:hypothetical protein
MNEDRKNRGGNKNFKRNPKPSNSVKIYLF